MKKNPVATFFATFLKSPWAIPAFTILGLLVGAALAFAAMRWVVPTLSTPQISTPAPTPKEEGDVFDGTVIYPFDEIGEVASLTVDWKSRPQKLTKSEIRTVLRVPMANSPDELKAFDIVFDNLIESSAGQEAYGLENAFGGMWRAGHVTSGKWEGGTVYHLRLISYGLGSWYRPIYLIQTEKSRSLIGVGRPHAEMPKVLIPLFGGVQFHVNATIQDIEAPETLTLLSGRQVVKQALAWDPGSYRFDITEPLREVAQTKEGWTLYEYVSAESEDSSRPGRVGCLLAFGPDGRMASYVTQIPTKPIEGEGMYRSMIPEVTWQQAYRAAEEKRYQDVQVGGCGTIGCVAVVSDAVVRAGGGIVLAGTTKDGDDIFVPVDPAQHPIVQEIYDSWFLPDGEAKPSREAFLKEYPVPVFYWKDALGRWIEHRSMDTLPPVECGKPVIYLYPKQTTDVSVRLPSFIDVTVSDPTYPTSGWNVTAQPDGQLTSHEDGNTYGSLYWEGTGVGYAPPNEGFAVKDGEVESFLADILPRYGLNETEAREFMEFWLPEMTGAPYYRVSFLTSAWSAAAPLFVSPRPQTSIRIFMDWKPLSAPTSIPAPEIVTPERNGFTLVEWGGTLWK